MGPKDPDRMANSVDPDQTAPLGLPCLIWVYTVCPDLSVRKVRIITVTVLFIFFFFFFRKRDLAFHKLNIKPTLNENHCLCLLQLEYLSLRANLSLF